MTNAYLGLGSDQGDRAAWLLQGLRELAAAGVRISTVSSIYLTEPVGDPELPWFLNCVAEVTNPPAPERLLELCLQVERRCGRRRGASGEAARGSCDPRHFYHGLLEARSLDLDVLLYDQLVVDGPRLAIPHPRMHERRFVLEPLVEIAPTAPHPLLARSVGELLAQLHRDERVWLLAPPPSEFAGTLRD